MDNSPHLSFDDFPIKAEVAHTEATGSRSGTVKAGNVTDVPSRHLEVTSCCYSKIPSHPQNVYFSMADPQNVIGCNRNMV